MGNPGSQPTPQLQIVVHWQLFGVVVSGSATSFVFRSPIFSGEADSLSMFSRANGHDAIGNNDKINLYGFDTLFKVALRFHFKKIKSRKLTIKRGGPFW